MRDDYRALGQQNHRRLRAFCHRTLEIGGYAESQRERRVLLLVELADSHWQGMLRFDNVGPGHGYPIGPLRVAAERLPDFTSVTLEFDRVLGRGIKQSVPQRQPERRNRGAVDALPEKFRRNVSAVYSALEPV